MAIDDILEEVKTETDYQEQKWGHTSDDTKNEPFHWASYIAYYSTNWMRGIWAPVQGSVVDGFRTSMIKVAALAVSAVASIDRQRAANGKTFYEQ